MKPLTCNATRRRIHAFCDGELSLAEQLAVDAHVDWCNACAAMVADIRLMGSALRLGARDCEPLSDEEAATFAAALVSRYKAERETSLVARLRHSFEDMHLVYAGVGATVATVACVLIMLGMMRFATKERSDSLAAIVDLLAAPEASANAMAIDRASQQRWTERSQAAHESAEQDAVFALAAIVTRDGRLANLHHLRSKGGRATREEARLIEALLDAVTHARIESSRTDATGAAANSMVWLVTRTTVHATKVVAMDLPLRPAKKRTAQLSEPSPLVKA